MRSRARVVHNMAAAVGAAQHRGGAAAHPRERQARREACLEASLLRGCDVFLVSLPTPAGGIPTGTTNSGGASSRQKDTSLNSAEGNDSSMGHVNSKAHQLRQALYEWLPLARPWLRLEAYREVCNSNDDSTCVGCWYSLYYLFIVAPFIQVVLLFHSYTSFVSVCSIAPLPQKGAHIRAGDRCLCSGAPRLAICIANLPRSEARSPSAHHCRLRGHLLSGLCQTARASSRISTGRAHGTGRCPGIRSGAPQGSRGSSVSMLLQYTSGLLLHLSACRSRDLLCLPLPCAASTSPSS